MSKRAGRSDDEDIFIKEKLYCPVCGTVILGFEETATATTGEEAHKECAEMVIERAY